MDMKSNSPDDPVLVILPGLLCDGRMFERQLEAFPRSRVIGGFYGGADSIGQMADYALARMPARSAVLGHSMGARVALEVYRRDPQRVARLALADTGVHPLRAGERDKRYALRDLGRVKGFEALVDAWLPGMIGPNRRSDPEFYDQLRAMCLDAGQYVFEAQIEALLGRPEVGTLLPAVSCPVAVIVGELDEWSPVEQHREIVAAIREADLHVVRGAGHMAPAEMPELFNRAMCGWLGRELLAAR
ncbi:MAG: alpha/beta hydrolase [Novosphingobium lindaniclasticum]|jgi:pimeloyl-ACP methyl ester carboxylesterase|uniref:alpha/beta fold hydrolase n=1 Tax=Novosphingobium lindaniclasticum TaxID=1329895 RepID=UPI0024097191|nr:alpha/beta hydrolase [Novosphingobium lindaniclasticum]MDF2638487.1 alpha/beta hydrolase [Novosphingobium lindaniclasticum]